MSTDAEKYQRYLARQRKASKQYYETKMKPNDTMTESQKLMLEDKLKKRREHYKNKYAENPEYYKQKTTEYRLRKKEQASTIN